MGFGGQSLTLGKEKVGLDGPDTGAVVGVENTG